MIAGSHFNSNSVNDNFLLMETFCLEPLPLTAVLIGTDIGNFLFVYFCPAARQACSIPTLHGKPCHNTDGGTWANVLYLSQEVLPVIWIQFSSFRLVSLWVVGQNEPQNSKLHSLDSASPPGSKLKIRAKSCVDLLRNQHKRSNLELWEESDRLILQDPGALPSLIHSSRGNKDLDPDFSFFS